MYTPVNPSFTKIGVLRGSTLYRHVFLMAFSRQDLSRRFEATKSLKKLYSLDQLSAILYKGDNFSDSACFPSYQAPPEKR